MISCDDMGDILGVPHKGVDGCNRGDIFVKCHNLGEIALPPGGGQLCGLQTLRRRASGTENTSCFKCKALNQTKHKIPPSREYSLPCSAASELCVQQQR